MTQSNSIAPLWSHLTVLISRLWLLENARANFSPLNFNYKNHLLITCSYFEYFCHPLGLTLCLFQSLSHIFVSLMSKLHKNPKSLRSFKHLYLQGSNAKLLWKKNKKMKDRVFSPNRVSQLKKLKVSCFASVHLQLHPAWHLMLIVTQAHAFLQTNHQATNPATECCYMYN